MVIGNVQVEEGATKTGAQCLSLSCLGYKTKKRSKFDRHLQLRSLGNFLPWAFPHISGGKVENRNRKKIQLHASNARKSSVNL